MKGKPTEGDATPYYCPHCGERAAFTGFDGKLVWVKPVKPGPPTTEGRKNDDDKLRYDLIPPGALAELARVYTIGAKKYADNNWRGGFKWGRIFAALMRHAWDWWGGERHDPRDGQHHLASVAWGAFTLIEFEKEKIGEDDRWKYS